MTSQSCSQPRKGGGQQWNFDVFELRETPGQTLVAGQLRSSYRRLKTKELSPIGLFEPFFDYEQSVSLLMKPSVMLNRKISPSVSQPRN